MFGRKRGDSTIVADDYVLSDSTLRSLDHGLGELRVEGELRGHLASIVGEMRFPSRQPWPWFLVIWLDGSKEQSFEDYGPKWYAVRELVEGHLEFYEPSVGRERVFFGRSFGSKRRGPDLTYDFAWLPSAEATRKWNELGLRDSDF